MLSIGLRVAQIKVVFCASERLRMARSASGVLDSSPLAYIEWFRPFRMKDAYGLHRLRRSTRHGVPHAEVVPLTRISRSCHLMARFKTAVDSGWNPFTVLRLCDEFYLNPWITVDDFLCMR